MTISDEDRVALSDVPTDAIRAELEARRVVVQVPKGTMETLIRLGCLLLARHCIPDEDVTKEAGYLKLFSLAKGLERYAREPPSGSAPARARPAPEPAPDLTPKEIMALCREIEAEAHHAGLGFFDLCTRHGINATSFQSWANGSVMPRAHNVRKLLRIMRDGVVPQRANGVDRELDRDPDLQAESPAP
jgi:hypothetical protein